MAIREDASRIVGKPLFVAHKAPSHTHPVLRCPACIARELRRHLEELLTMAQWERTPTRSIDAIHAEVVADLAKSVPDGWIPPVGGKA